MTFPSHTSYKPSGYDWVGNIPSDWRVQKFRHLFRESSEKIESEVFGEMLSVSGYRGIERKEYDDENRRRNDEDLIGYRIVRRGQLVVNTMWLNYAGLGFSDLDGHVSPAYRAYWPRTDESARYLHYLLRSEFYVKGYTRLLTGVRPNSLQMSRDNMMSFPVILPDREEQLAIASFLDRETAKIDALIAEQQRLVELLQEKRQAVISHAVTKGLNSNAPMKDSGVKWLGEVPGHWEVTQLNKLICKITNGYVGPTRDILQGDGVRYLQSLHIKGNRILFETPYFVSKEWSISKDKSILHEGDVLVVQTGDIGQSAVVTKEFEDCNCHALIVISPIRALMSGNWLSWVLNSAYGKETLLSIQTGALHPHLNCGNVKYINIPVPPVEEQLAICEHISSKNRETDQLIATAYSSIELMRERRSALISAAVTGQIDVRGLAEEEEP